MSTTPLHLGLIGAGEIGRLHAGNIARHLPEARILIVADEDEAAARKCADDCRVKFAIKEYHPILASPAIDAVLICAPIYLRAQLIEEAAAAGKHIYCVAPIDFDLSKADRALAVVEQFGVKLQIGFHRRFDATHLRLRQILAEGEIGTPESIHLVGREPAVAAVDGRAASAGLLFDTTIHDFDTARFLLGSEVVELYVAAGSGDTLESALITLKFASGAIGSIDSSRKAHCGYDQRVEVFGSKGSVRADNVYTNSAIVSTSQHVQRDLPVNSSLARYQESFVQEMRSFVEAVRNNSPIVATGGDGRAAIVMALAAQKSLEENRPVKLSEVGYG